MAIFLKTAECKLESQNTGELIRKEDVEETLENSPSVDQLQYILYKYPCCVSEDFLVKLLKHDDNYVFLKAFSLLTDLYKHKAHRKEYVVAFKYMIVEDLTYEQKNQLISFFVMFISCKSSTNFNLEDRKHELIEDKSLTSILKRYITIKELQYNILLFLYVYSFTDFYIDKISVFSENLVAILKDRGREKILRICYLIIVNILKSKHELSMHQINEYRKITTTLCELNINDTVLAEKLKVARKLLNKKHEKYTFRNYASDLFNGILEDHDYHYDETFWHSGLPIISKNLVEIIKILKKYLKSHHNEWVRLACNDIYMLVKVNPQAYGLLSKHKVRDILFELTKSENDEIRFNAIQALYASIFSEWS